MLSGSVPDMFIVTLKSVPVELSKTNVILTRPLAIPADTLVLITERLMINLCDAVFVLVFIDWLLKIVTFGGVFTVNVNVPVVFTLSALSLAKMRIVVVPATRLDTFSDNVKLFGPEPAVQLFAVVMLNGVPWVPLLTYTTIVWIEVLPTELRSVSL